MNYFLENPTARLRVRQIERTLKLPLPSVIRYTKELKDEKILKDSDVAGIKLYSADILSNEYKLEKKCHNLKRTIKSGLIEYLKKELINPTIVLFGSYSKAEDIESSDIDLYIETQGKEKINLEKYEKILNKKIQVFIYPNIKKIENKELANNIINGIVLNGFLEVL